MDENLKKEVIKLLEIIKNDAEMALDGRWVAVGEGLDGFEDQITLIDSMLIRLGVKVS